MIHTADAHNSDGAPLLLAEIIRCHPWLRHIFADGGYAGGKLRQALRRIGKWKVEMIKRSDHANGFEALPRSWVAERTLGWLRA
jgi:putative transposase